MLKHQWTNFSTDGTMNGYVWTEKRVGYIGRFGAGSFGFCRLYDGLFAAGSTPQGRWEFDVPDFL